MCRANEFAAHRSQRRNRYEFQIGKAARERSRWLDQAAGACGVEGHANDLAIMQAVT